MSCYCWIVFKTRLVKSNYKIVVKNLSLAIYEELKCFGIYQTDKKLFFVNSQMSFTAQVLVGYLKYSLTLIKYYQILTFCFDSFFYIPFRDLICRPHEQQSRAQTTMLCRSPCFDSLAIRLRSEDLKHNMPRPVSPGLQGQHI